MKKIPVILSAALLGMPLVGSGEDDLTVLTNQPGKQLELLLKRQFNRQVDKRTEAYNALKSGRLRAVAARTPRVFHSPNRGIPRAYAVEGKNRPPFKRQGVSR